MLPAGMKTDNTAIARDC